ncbi:O-linked N-acetylglucosamine transferase, SPINDLY family protein, partial [Fischerella thermalis CCMEE 5196]
TQLDEVRIVRLFNAFFFSPYLEDNPKKNRSLQNRLLQLCQANIVNYAKEQVEKYFHRNLGRKKTNHINNKIKLGYLSHCLRSHSVGWLARWLFQYHDRDKFQIHAYFINTNPEFDPLHEWYLSNVDKAYKLSKTFELAEQIYQDEIDILIDLDSITLDITCEVVSLKPAPIQVTWLGFDASGSPSIDYFIADPYVLPESAQEYYTEKIWRLPHTYIGIDGFEVSVPTITREQLDIPHDAVVYLCAQRGFKRHPDITRLQLRILKEVPNSYFLIKGISDEESTKAFFEKLAEEEGVDTSKFRFLPIVVAESVHRANLEIADIVLDTYPYNGATTTLETLWMCIPMVTRVGEQFAARNSYTMMMNAGITEGIAWTDEEYVEWGVRLGKDEALRQQIAWKLKKSRKTSPLWNGKQFTSEMEKAYEQMWKKYLEEE